MNERSTGSARKPVLDPEMLRGVCARQPEALNAFFEHFFDRAYAYATRLLNDPTQAQDLVQEAFLRMHAAIDRLDPERDPAPWVFSIITNLARDHWRSRLYRTQQRQVDIEEAWNAATDAIESNPERMLQRSEDASAIEQALAQLSPADREVILLKEYESLTTAEVAELLDLKPEAIRQRYSRAVRRLAQVYKAEAKKDSGSP